MRKLLAVAIALTISQTSLAKDNPGYFTGIDYGIMELDTEVGTANVSGDLNYTALTFGYTYHDELNWEVSYGKSSASDKININENTATNLESQFVSAKLSARTKGTLYWNVEVGLVHSITELDNIGKTTSTDFGAGIGVGARTENLDAGINYFYADEINLMSISLDYKF